ncbi:hypothetical protein [Salinisphaera dokdonensis]|uniref:hypothetical protein n=1 Tax=Salinisphaera dokdonensis TaxID=454598 RepID=UPI00333FED11
MPQTGLAACRIAMRVVHVFTITEMMPSTDGSIIPPPRGPQHKTIDRRTLAGDYAKEKP